VKRFAFRLARLERLRATARKEAHASLAKALGEALEREREREGLEARHDEARRTDLPDDVAEDPGALRALHAWRESCRALAFDAACREVRAFDEALRAEAVHADAARDHRVLERLRHRRHAAWLEDAEREQQKFLDEVHILRVTREQREEVR
jgi:hypothetical protein